MKFKLISLIACLMLLASCHYLPDGRGEDLLVAPLLNRQQLEINRALNTTLDLSKIVYRYPQDGDYRSPFVFYDMDGDGLDEAVVLYAPDVESSEVRAMVLRQSLPGEWYSFADLAGQGNQVDFVAFADLFANRGSSIVIGWRDTSFQQRAHLGVYSIQGETIVQDMMESRVAHIIQDFEEDGRSELVLVQRATDGYRLRLMGELGGSLLEFDSKLLYYETSDVLQLLSGVVRGGGEPSAIYIDQEVAGVFYATEVYRVDGHSLILLAGSSNGEEGDAWQNYLSTFREQKVLSVDLHGDGAVEVPQTRWLPGAETDTGEAASTQLTQYMRYTAEGFQPLFNAAVNIDAGYLVYFPDRWLGNVTVTEHPERSEWRFYKVSPDNMRPVLELLRIRVYSTQDYQDFDEDDILLGSKGIFRYYAYIPSGIDDPLLVTRSEAMTMFALL